MNRHFQRLAEVVGRALAERWMRRSGGEDAAGSNAGSKPDSAPAPVTPPRRPRMHHRQHR